MRLEERERNAGVSKRDKVINGYLSNSKPWVKGMKGYWRERRNLVLDGEDGRRIGKAVVGCHKSFMKILMA